MDTLQEQINILSIKVDALSDRIEQMSARMTDVATECKFGAETIQRSETKVGETYRPSSRMVSNLSMEHKDILVDADEFDTSNQGSEKQLAPEVQIQRLTAQLTAAYNRIAALEEQLLSKKRMLH